MVLEGHALCIVSVSMERKKTAWAAVGVGRRRLREQSSRLLVEGVLPGEAGKDSRLDAMWVGAVPTPLPPVSPSTRIGARVCVLSTPILGQQLLQK